MPPGGMLGPSLVPEYSTYLMSDGFTCRFSMFPYIQRAQPLYPVLVFRPIFLFLRGSRII